MKKQEWLFTANIQPWSIDSNLLTLWHKIDLRGLRTAFYGELTQNCGGKLQRCAQERWGRQCHWNKQRSQYYGSIDKWRSAGLSYFKSKDESQNLQREESRDGKVWIRSQEVYLRSYRCSRTLLKSKSIPTII